ncbi:MAG: hypothetical protein QF877_06380 [Gammaproteobacteria bacterium]|nr:hypothetical protein [Gammaproteobacteria bacterium]
MKFLGFGWGIGGVLILLLSAIYRLTPMVLALENSSMHLLHWAALIFSIVYMAYAEGYKGFHLGFAPRVVVRAIYLHQNPRIVHMLLAPLFCMGYFYATRRRKMISIGLTLMIICFIIIARMLPQPWRGIVDAGVVVGLTIGVASIIYFVFLAYSKPEAIQASAETPGDT